MAQLIYRGNTQQMAFPLLSTLSSRTVLDPGPDHTFVRGVSAGESVPPDMGVPGAYYVHNVMPSTYGWRAVSYYPITAGANILPPESETGDWLHTDRDTGNILRFPLNHTVQSGEFIFGIDSDRTAAWQYTRNGEWRKLMDLDPNSFTIDYVALSQGQIVVKKQSSRFEIMYLSKDFKTAHHKNIGASPFLYLIDGDDLKRLEYWDKYGTNVQHSKDWGTTWVDINKADYFANYKRYVRTSLFRTDGKLVMSPSQGANDYLRPQFSSDNARNWRLFETPDPVVLISMQASPSGQPAMSLISTRYSNPSEVLVTRVVNNRLVTQKLRQNGTVHQPLNSRAGLIVPWYDLYVCMYQDGSGYKGFRANSLPPNDGDFIEGTGEPLDLPLGAFYAPFFVSEQRMYRLSRDFKLT